jgi:aspartate kinase
VSSPLVVKFGGDALALPDRIANAARLVRQRLRSGPVVAVASARRGVTDHLLGLVDQVKESTAGEPRVSGELAAAAERAVASGELVSASLLAVALNQLGIRAQVLDAREARLQSNGDWGRAQLTAIDTNPVTRLFRRGITPVVTGFQGWYRGRTTTLGRGGSDTTAAALAAALSADRCELVKHHGGVFTADPKIVPDAKLLSSVSHRFLTELAAAGAKVISLRAALLAERQALSLRFSSMHGEIPFTDVVVDAPGQTTGIALRSGWYRFAAQSARAIELHRQTAFLDSIAEAGIHAELELVQDGTGSRLDLLVDPGDLDAALDAARALLPRGRQLVMLATGLSTVTVVGVPAEARSGLQHLAQRRGAQLRKSSPEAGRMVFLLGDDGARDLARELHDTLFALPGRLPEHPSQHELNPQVDRRAYVGHR